MLTLIIPLLSSLTSTTALMATTAPPHNTCHAYVYQNNGTLTIGRDEKAGGSITWLSDNAVGTNLVNNLDLGRQIQMSCQGEFPAWNPTMAGDGANPANCERFFEGTGYVYSKCTPLIFLSSPYYTAGPTPATDLHFHVWSEFLPSHSGRAFMVTTLIQNRTNKHGPVLDQETNPVCFFNADQFSSGLAYTGLKPWTLALTSPCSSFTSVVPAPAPPIRSSEGWVALVDATGCYGVATMSNNPVASIGANGCPPPPYSCVTTGDHQYPSMGFDHAQRWAFDRGAATEQLREGRELFYVGSITDARAFFSNYKSELSGAFSDTLDTTLNWDINGTPVTIVNDTGLGGNSLDIGGSAACGSTTGESNDVSLRRKYWGEATYAVSARLNCVNTTYNYGLYGVVFRKGGDANFTIGDSSTRSYYMVYIDSNSSLHIANGSTFYNDLVPAVFVPSVSGLSGFSPTIAHTLSAEMDASSLTVKINGIYCMGATAPTGGWDFGPGYCSLFARDCDTRFRNFSVTPGSGIPADSTPPSSASGFTVAANASISAVDLGWTNPSPSSDWLWTRVVRKEGSAPTHWHDGIMVYEGKLDHYTDVDVGSGATYYYAAYTCDHAGNWATPATGSVSLGAMTFTSRTCEDGYISGPTSISASAGGFNAPGELRVGDSLHGNYYKSILSFDTSALTSSATITSATLTLTSGLTTGSSLSSLGTLTLDVVAGNFGTSADLEGTAGDFSSAPTSGTYVSGVTTSIQAPFTNGGAISITLPSTAWAAINKTGLTQIRLYFSTASNSNGAEDYVSFHPGGDATQGYVPTLTVGY